MIHPLAVLSLFGASSSKSTSSGSSYFLVFLVVIGVAVWFLFLRPQQQKAKKQRESNSQVGLGDTVVTIGGIVGTVVSMEDDRVVIRTASTYGTGNHLEFVRRAISSRLEEAPVPEGAHPEFELQPGGEAPVDGQPAGATGVAGNGTSSSLSEATVTDAHAVEADAAVDGDTETEGHAEVSVEAPFVAEDHAVAGEEEEEVTDEERAEAPGKVTNGSGPKTRPASGRRRRSGGNGARRRQ